MKKNPAAVALGSRGGKKTSQKHGKEHYQRLAANMNKKLGRTGKKGTQAVKKSKLDMPFSVD